MNIKQIIINDDQVYIFTDNPREDVKILIEKYEARTSKINLGYEVPTLTRFNFLGKDYDCINLWFDNEDIPDFYKDFRPQTGGEK